MNFKAFVNLFFFLNKKRLAGFTNMCNISKDFRFMNFKASVNPFLRRAGVTNMCNVSKKILDTNGHERVLTFPIYL